MSSSPLPVPPLATSTAHRRRRRVAAASCQRSHHHRSKCCPMKPPTATLFFSLPCPHLRRPWPPPPSSLASSPSCHLHRHRPWSSLPPSVPPLLPPPEMPPLHGRRPKILYHRRCPLPAAASSSKPIVAIAAASSQGRAHRPTSPEPLPCTAVHTVVLSCFHLQTSPSCHWTQHPSTAAPSSLVQPPERHLFYMAEATCHRSACRRHHPSAMAALHPSPSSLLDPSYRSRHTTSHRRDILLRPELLSTTGRATLIPPKLLAGTPMTAATMVIISPISVTTPPCPEQLPPLAPPSSITATLKLSTMLSKLPSPLL